MSIKKLIMHPKEISSAILTIIISCFNLLHLAIHCDRWVSEETKL